MTVRHLEVIELGALRAERQRMARECDRLVWLRRLVVARLDLEVARLTGADEGLWGETDTLSATVRASLGDAGAGATPQLLRELSESVRALTLAVGGARRDRDRATDELVRRYRRQPELCLLAVDAPGCGR